MRLYDMTVPQLVKMLRNVDSWLATAIAFADRRRFDVNNLMKARLAPDQFAFDRQVQTACDNAKFIPARLAGKEWPAHPDVETGADERRISLPWMEGKWMRGDEWVTQFALPNFYFHVTTAYAILRHNGIELGKRDYIGGVVMRS
jgi:hypothetical protein